MYGAISKAFLHDSLVCSHYCALSIFYSCPCYDLDSFLLLIKRRNDARTHQNLTSSFPISLHEGDTNQARNATLVQHLETAHLYVQSDEDLDVHGLRSDGAASDSSLAW